MAFLSPQGTEDLMEDRLPGLMGNLLPNMVKVGQASSVLFANQVPAVCVIVAVIDKVRIIRNCRYIYISRFSLQVMEDGRLNLSHKEHLVTCLSLCLCLSVYSSFFHLLFPLASTH